MSDPQAVSSLRLDHTKPSIFLTCEHASNAVPTAIDVSATDQRWLDSHWGFDRGARDLTTKLSEQLKCPAVLGGYSRLVCDLNRSADQATWIREACEDVALDFNRALSQADRAQRFEAVYQPFHHTVDQALARYAVSGARPLIFSVHTFTRRYEGETRPFELGVLFSDHDPLAKRFGDLLRVGPWEVRLNEPYSGKDGFIYSAERHGRKHDVPFLELEVRDDLFDDEKEVHRLAGLVTASLQQLVQNA